MPHRFFAPLRIFVRRFLQGGGQIVVGGVIIGLEFQSEAKFFDGALRIAHRFVGVIPRAVLTCRAGKAHVRWYDVDGDGSEREATWDAADPTAALAEVMAEWKPVETPGLPRFWGGAVGWISYDVVRCFEDLPKRASDDLGLPEVCMVITDTLVIFDNLRQTIKVVATPHVPRSERASEIYDKAIARGALCDRIEGVVLAGVGADDRAHGKRAQAVGLDPFFGDADFNLV